MNNSIKLALANTEIELNGDKLNIICGDFASGKTRLLEQRLAASASRAFELANSLQSTLSYDPTEFLPLTERLPTVHLIGRRGKLPAESLLTYMNLSADLVQALAHSLHFICPSCQSDSPYHPNVQQQLDAIKLLADGKLISVGANISVDRLNHPAMRGFNKFILDSSLVELDLAALANHQLSSIEVCIDRLKVSDENAARLASAIAQAFELGSASVTIRPLDQLKQRYFLGASVACRSCGHCAPILQFILAHNNSSSSLKLSGWLMQDTPIERFVEKTVAQINAHTTTADPKIQAAMTALDQVGLAHLAINASVLTLSPEERQRLRFALLLLAAPKSALLIFPDLLNNCSPLYQQQTLHALKRFIRDKNIVVLSAGDSPVEAGSLSIHTINLMPVVSLATEATKAEKPARSGAIITWIRIDTIGLSTHYTSQLKRAAQAKQLAANINVIGDFSSESSRTVADMLGCSEQLATFFAALEDARIEGLVAETFLRLRRNKLYRCELCHGRGFSRRSIGPAGQYIPHRCISCYGSGVNGAQSTVRFRGLTFSEILALSLETLAGDFSAIIRRRRALEALCALGLGKLAAHAPMWCLRPSERTAVMLASLPKAQDERAAMPGLRIVCSDITSHLSRISIEPVLRRLSKSLSERDYVYIISSDWRLEEVVRDIKTACSFEQLNATIMQ